MTFFWILWGFDALVALVVIGFFFVGIADGSVSDRNILLWLGMLATVTVVLLGGFLLMKSNYLGLAKSLLSLLAVPGFLMVLMAFLALFVKDWR